MQISGVSVKLVGDQAKLMENVSKSWTGSAQGKFSGKAKPQEEMLTSGADFASIIPSGFLLLHKDLKALIDGKSSQKSGLMTILDAVGPILAAVGAVVIAGTIVKGLFGGNSEKSGGHIQDIIDDLNMRLTADDVANYPEVQEAQREGLATYMKCYFIAQGTSAVVSATLGAVGTGAAAAVTGLVSGLLGKETKDDAQLHLKDIIDQIILSQDPAAWAEEANTDGTGLHTEVKVGIMTYLGLWFAAQAVSMTAETVAAGAGNAVGGAINSLFTSLFGKKTEETSTTHLKEIIDAIITAQSPEEWAAEAREEGALKTEVKIGVMTYLGLWFAAQAISMTAETVSKGVGSSIGGAINSLFTSLFGKKKPDTLESKLQDILNSIITGINSKDSAIINSDEVQTAVRNGMATYVSAYFLATAAAATATNAGESAGDAVAGFFKSLFGKKSEKAENDPMVKLGDKMQDIIIQVTNAIKPEQMSSDDLLELAQKGIHGFVEGYFNTLSSNMDGASAGAALSSFFGGGNSIINSEISSIILEHVKTALSDLKIDDIKTDLNPVMAQGIGDIALEIFDQENSKIKKWYSSSLSKDQVQSALGGISEAYLKAVKTSIENGFKVETTSTVTSKADSRVIEALTQIQAILNSISGDTGIIKDKQSLVMINGGDSGADEPTVYSSLSGSESR